MYLVSRAAFLALVQDLEAQNFGIFDVSLVSFHEEVDHGESGATPVIDWNNGQKQRILLTSNAVALSFVPPPGPCNVILKVVQDGVGGRAITTFPSNSKAPSGTLTFSTNPHAEDLAAIYYDGQYYYWTLISDLLPL